MFAELSRKKTYGKFGAKGAKPKRIRYKPIRRLKSFYPQINTDKTQYRHREGEACGDPEVFNIFCNWVVFVLAGLPRLTARNDWFIGVYRHHQEAPAFGYWQLKEVRFYP